MAMRPRIRTCSPEPFGERIGLPVGLGPPESGQFPASAHQDPRPVRSKTDRCAGDHPSEPDSEGESGSPVLVGEVARCPAKGLKSRRVSSEMANVVREGASWRHRDRFHCILLC